MVIHNEVTSTKNNRREKVNIIIYIYTLIIRSSNLYSRIHAAV